MQNPFQGTPSSPYHISIGAVVRNAEGKICCHYFDFFTHEKMGTFTDFVLLMRETIEPGESIEGCLARGMMEEFGMKAEMKSFVGSIVSKFNIANTDILVEKTTLYFLCDFVSIDESLRHADDLESKSEICWMDPQELIAKMKEQGARLGREDVDESVVVERAVGKK